MFLPSSMKTTAVLPYLTRHRRTPSGWLEAFLPRRVRYVLAFLLLPAFLWLLCPRSGNSLYGTTVKVGHESNPPNYYEWHEQEIAMPQNNPDLPEPQGKEGRYLRFKNHLTSECPGSRLRKPSDRLAAVGWGNSMQEMIANHHLAYRTNRMYDPQRACLVAYITDSRM